MCAILDANLVTIVFGTSATDGARAFRRWVESGRGRLGVGGLLRHELSSNQTFQLWIQQAVLSGRAKSISDEAVDCEAGKLEARGACRSNDEHIIALARLSGARLLYSRDSDLRDDFKNPELLNDPKGKIYPESQGAGARRWLDRQRNLCEA